MENWRVHKLALLTKNIWETIFFYCSKKIVTEPKKEPFLPFLLENWPMIKRFRNVLKT